MAEEKQAIDIRGGKELSCCQQYATHIEWRTIPTVKKYIELGIYLVQVQGAVQWYIGDWLRMGEEICGHSYEEAVQAVVNTTGLDRHTITDCSLVAKEFSNTARRRAELSWGHHRALLDKGLEKSVGKKRRKQEQKRWLEKAVKGDGDGKSWSVHRLRDEIKKKYSKKKCEEGTEIQSGVQSILSMFVERFLTSTESEKQEFKEGFETALLAHQSLREMLQEIPCIGS